MTWSPGALLVPGRRRRVCRWGCAEGEVRARSAGVPTGAAEGSRPGAGRRPALESVGKVLTALADRLGAGHDHDMTNEDLDPSQHPVVGTECLDTRCVHCKNDLDFDMPEGLVEAALKRKVVIFAGAGISTEVPEVFPTTIYEMALRELGEIGSDEDTFPEVMSRLEERHGRTRLVQMIKEKFDYIDCYPFLRNTARAFHYELATMPYIHDVVTTNWDTYFEEECGAIPIVTGEDIAFHGMAGRKVLKIHGSISQVGSITATETDYQARLDSLGADLMGGLLRSLLATRTVVFVGYSLRDWNFRRLYEALQSDMKSFAPRAYVVDPFAVNEVNDFGMRVLKTSGVHFLRRLKDECVGHCVISDEVFGPLAKIRDDLDECDSNAKAISVKEYPSVLYCWFYHDGMRDALDRIRHRRNTGEYSDRHTVEAKLRTYLHLQGEAEDDERWDDYAYIDGFVNVLFLLIDDDYGRKSLEGDDGKERETSMRDSLPMYFMYGATSAMQSEEEFMEAVGASRRRSPKTRKWAKAAAEGIPDGMVTHHEPFLPMNS